MITVEKKGSIDATINGHQFRPGHIEIERKVREGGDVPHKLIIFTEQEDVLAGFCKDGEQILAVEIRWETRNESATQVEHRVRCRFESSRLISETAIDPISGDPDKDLLESVWRIIRWEASSKSVLKGAKKR